MKLLSKSRGSAIDFNLGRAVESLGSSAKKIRLKSRLGLSLALAICALPAAAQVIGPVNGLTAAQAPMTVESWGRYDTDTVDLPTLDALSLAPVLAGPLYSLGAAVNVQYVGTSAGRSGALFLAGAGSFDASAFMLPVNAAGIDNLAGYNPASGAAALFDTRAGCDLSTALADPDCLIDTVGQNRDIQGLSLGQSWVLGFQGWTESAGSTAEQRAHVQYFFADSAAQNGGTARVRALDLGAGNLLLGFEEGSDANFTDVVVKISGASVTMPVPELPMPAQLLAGLAALSLMRKRVKDEQTQT